MSGRRREVATAAGHLRVLIAAVSGRRVLVADDGYRRVTLLGAAAAVLLAASAGHRGRLHVLAEHLGIGDRSRSWVRRQSGPPVLAAATLCWRAGPQASSVGGW